MAQKTLIQLVQTIAAELSFPTPQAVVSSQDANVAKLFASVRAVCDDLLVEHDWQALQQRATFTSVANQEAYPWPSDVQRFISGTFFDQNQRWPMRGPLTPTEWESLKASQLGTSVFQPFRVMGNKLLLCPIPQSSGFTGIFEYQSSNYVRDPGSGLTKPDFTQDSDVCLFDHRVVVYGVKLKWQASIGMDTTAALVEYNRALEFAKGNDIPSQRLSLTGGCGPRLLSTSNIPDTGFGV